jgi:hypothetical protein
MNIIKNCLKNHFQKYNVQNYSTLGPDPSTMRFFEGHQIQRVHYFYVKTALFSGINVI